MKSFLIAFLLALATIGFAQDWNKSNSESMRLYQVGDYANAIAKADEALALAETQFGTVSDQYIASLSNKGYALSASGNYLSAISIMRTATITSFKLYQKPHVVHMQTLGELAKGFMEVALYDSVENYLNISRYIFNSVQRENRAHYDTSAFVLLQAYTKINSIEASLMRKKGQTHQAINILLEQLPMIKELYPDDFSTLKDYQITINNLATYYNEVGAFEEAIDHAFQYNQLVEKNSNSLDRIYALQSLASIYRNVNMLDSANIYWQEALHILEKSNYHGSRIHSIVLNNLGEINLEIENYVSSIDYLTESLSIQTNNESINPPIYQTTLSNLAESYRWSGDYKMADSLYSGLITELVKEVSHNFTYLTDNEKLSFYNNQVSFVDNYTGFALEIAGIIPLQESDTPYVRAGIAGDLYDLQLSTKALVLNASRRMKNAILQGQDTTLIRIYTLWEERKNQFAQAVSKGEMDAESLKWLEIKIEENEKWLTANSRNFRSGFQMSSTTWKDVQKSLGPDEAAVEIIRLIDGLIYGALIITPETTENPVFSLIMSTQSKHLEREFFKRYVNSITFQVQDTSSYKIYWHPIVSGIIGSMPGKAMPNRIYVSNDGIYNQINLNSLYNPKTSNFVIDETEIVLVTNTKELVDRQKPRPSKGSNTAALFGRPTFSSDSIGRGFSDLPGSGKEVQLIKDILSKANWSTELFMNDQATEENIKTLKPPKVLHLASHGFFNPGDGILGNTLAETLMRSGIALADIRKADDGLLTAYEVTSLDLDSTELVILSACETAKGVNNHGEGVYGLQRALEVAGVRNMIMSLWKVDDEATQLLMVKFYEKWISTNNLRASFRSAQKELRTIYPEPYYWGAFILAGI